MTERRFKLVEDPNGPLPETWLRSLGHYLVTNAIPPAPWEPSDEDCMAYVEATEGWARPLTPDIRANAAAVLIAARERGFDAVPKRLEGEGR